MKINAKIIKLADFEEKEPILFDSECTIMGQRIYIESSGDLVRDNRAFTKMYDLVRESVHGYHIIKSDTK